MDKLQPVIKHHFWICLGLAVIFTMVGWMSANGAISDAIKADQDKVKAAEGKTTAGQDAPNQTWIDGAAAMNKKDEEALKSSSLELYKRQIHARVWHSSVHEVMKDIMFGASIDESIPPRYNFTKGVIRSKWGRNYEKRFEEILDVVQPFDRKDGSGLVLVTPRAIDASLFGSWQKKSPLSTEIWDAQEDLWLRHSILKSIADVNEKKGAQK
ncbi:MAG: hypothetical protein KDA96_05060, partial [Planctomycetaceae bacterium]|nr:hypothetical protein [Planctomycetaceae bacterium]